MRKVVILGLVLMLVLSIAATSYAQESVALGDSITETKGSDPMEYSFNGISGMLVSISLESDAFDAMLRLQDSLGSTIATDDDGGEGTNSLLTVMISSDDTYTIVVDEWGMSGGEFTLTVTEAVVTKLSYGTQEVVFADESLKYLSFEGTAGAVIHLYGDSGEADLDSKFTLYGPDNVELTYDDDGGTEFDPAIVRFMLPQDGKYLVKVTTFFDELSTGVLLVTLEETELLTLDKGSLTITLGSQFDYDIVRFTATLGGRYRLTLHSTGSELDVRAMVKSSGWTNPAIDLDAALMGMFEFLAPAEGVTEIELRSGYYYEEVTFEIAVEPVQ